MAGFGKAVGPTAKYTYDGQDIILDDGSEGIVKYQNGPGIDNKLKMVIGGQSKYFLQDHLGSTVALTGQDGAVLEQTNYEAFGEPTDDFSTRYQFTGRERDPFTGLYDYRARWYNPQLGRFISEDPIGFGGGDVNLYGYVKNDALNLVDPLGLQTTNGSGAGKTPGCGCDEPGVPKSWCMPQFGDGPFTQVNPYTSPESGNFSGWWSHLWNEPVGALGRLGTAAKYYGYNYGVKYFLGEVGAAGPKGRGGVPGVGEMINVLEIAPDALNTAHILDRKNQDINDIISGKPSPYEPGKGLGGVNNGWYGPNNSSGCGCK